jgi:2-octaprenyl-6-methoxyphenol hydroxylase
VSSATDNRVIVAGTGPAGLVAAVALGRQGADVTLIGEAAPELPGRTVALFDGSMRLLAQLGLADELKAHGAPLRKLRIVDDTGNLFHAPELVFEAQEIGLDAFGWNIPAERLTAALRSVAAGAKGIRLIEGLANEPSFGDAASGSTRLASLTVGEQRIEAPLIVAADGQRSRLRQAAGITTRVERLAQSAVIAILRHQLTHEDCSTEFHLRGGPCTLVPLPMTACEHRAEAPAEFPYASSLVWMLERHAAEELAGLDEDAFALVLERRVHSILGKLRVASPRGIVPLSTLHVSRIVGRRLALVGEAAHAFPPIGAQGLNLGLRDASALASLVGKALRKREDIGGRLLLEAYDADRQSDIATRSTAVTLMNRSLLSSFLPADLARSLGMATLGMIGPLRRHVMRQGIEPRRHCLTGAARNTA